MTIKTPKKLIEVALPLDDINIACGREKSIRHGHPSTLHLWWARRPLAAARAVIFAQMVNDPGGHRGYGPGMTKAQAQIERERLFGIIRKLVLWENTNNEDVLAEARAEIWQSWRETCALNKSHPEAATLFNPEKLPAFHDPFAGGGALPLEAQRLGLESYASDLNPVAVLINKAMIEIPPKFAGQEPVGPLPPATHKKNATRDICEDWSGAKGLAEDVRRYGYWMREEAFKRIGHLYPQVDLESGLPVGTALAMATPTNTATVIAWLWVRTVKSPNPAFSHVDVPLASTFILSSKVGKEAYVQPVIDGDSYRFEVRTGKPPEGAKHGTKLTRGANFRCLLSESPIQPSYIKSEGLAGRIGAKLMAVVAEGARGRTYLAPTNEMEAIANQAQPEWRPETDLPNDPRNFWTLSYGLTKFSDLFTDRQLVALTTFSDLVQEARAKIKADHLGAWASRPQKEWHSHGRLPHWEGGEIPQSITFRLYDSLPQTLLEQWREELARLPETEHQSERRKRIDAALDAGYGECWLREPRIAKLVEDALLHFDGQRYQLHAWVVMPNHVHVLITPLHGYSLSSLVHSWKSFTAKEANRLLGREGAFWLEDYFDRAVRDERHFNAVVEYIENNPVKAGLCQRAADWRYGGAGDGEAKRAGRPRSQDDVPLDEGGTGATAYADAVAVYLAIAVSRISSYWSNITSHDTSREKITSVFARQAIPMVWDFIEGNPFSKTSGNFLNSIEAGFKSLREINSSVIGIVKQANAAEQSISANKVISTDPPYYDNIGYADLSDFFYIWLRRSLRPIYPNLFVTMAVPKAEELVATPYRHGSKQKAEKFFLDGMTEAMHRLAEQAHPAFPTTIYYAFKQSDTTDIGTGNTGWETFLAAVLRAGFVITGTWPMRTEMKGRALSRSGTNALTSSIVLVCRQRDTNAETISRREFLRELKQELSEAIELMIGGAEGISPVAPVDLAQAVIGPGMAIFSKYAAVLEADGKTMTVHDALVLINRTITEGGDDFDADTQFALSWFDEQGWSEGEFGKADVLARAKGTSVAGIANAGVLETGAGKVSLLKWPNYPDDWSPERDNRTPVWEALHQLIRVLNQQGESAAGKLIAKMPERSDAIRQLAYRLYTLCERKGWAEDARAYNELIGAWLAIVDASMDAGHKGEQLGLDQFGA